MARRERDVNEHQLGQLEFDLIRPLHDVVRMLNNRLHDTLLGNDNSADDADYEMTFLAKSLLIAVRNVGKDAVMEMLRTCPDACKAIDREGRSMLHQAVQFDEPQAAIIEILELFLDLGLDVNAKTTKGETPLWLAVKKRMNEVIEFLVARGADPMVRNEQGDTLAHMIVKEIEAYCSEHEVFSYMSRDYAYFSLSENTGFGDWLDWLLSKGCIDVDCPNASGETAYRLAIEKNLKIISLILAKYTRDVTFTNNYGQNILHVFLNMDTYSYSYVNNHTNEIWRILLEKGVPVNAVDDGGRTPIHIAAHRQKATILAHMLEHFTDVNACNELGDTALHIVINLYDAFGFRSQFEEIIRRLISKGADIYMKNKNGMTPVQLAAKHKDERVLRVLQEHQADFSIRTDDGDTLLHLLSRTNMEQSADPDVVELLVKQNCNVNATNAYGMTPLHLAATTGCVTVVKGLLKHGADVRSRDTRDQMTPLHLAALQNREEMIEELVKAGADVHSKEASGKTPLHLATRHGTGSLLKTLLKFGALLDAKDNNGRLPLHDVLLNDNPEGLDCLLACGADINDLGTPQQIPFLDVIRTKMIWNRMVEHLVKLKAAKMPIASVFKPYINLNSQPMKKFFRECLQEIEGMKKMTITGRMTLYDLLLLDPYHRYSYVRNMGFKVLLISPRYFENTFPKYCGLIRTSHKEAIERKPLLEPAKYAWYQLAKISLPDICIERVLAYLNNSELKTMIEGAEIEMET